MGPVISDVAAAEEAANRLIFTCLFSLSLLCVFLLRRIMYYLVVTFSVTID